MYEFETRVQFIKGVGEKLAGLLSKKDIYTLGDLLEYYPRAYEDRRRARNIKSLKEGELVSLVAQIKSVNTQNMGMSKRKIYTVTVQDESGVIACKYFRAPYRGYFERLQSGTKIRLIGKTTNYRGRIEFHHPDIKDFDEKENDNSVVAIYPESERLSSRKIRTIISTAIEKLGGGIEDPLPDWIKQKYALADRAESVLRIHQPPDEVSEAFLELASPYHERLKFDEFFSLELYLAAKKSGIQKEKGLKLEPKFNKLKELEASLSFKLTNAQKRSLNEIIANMQTGYPMHRLVQGDVGCGKTLVALMSAVFASSNGYQCAMMVPTEILANQHYKNAKELLEPLGLRIGFLTGMQKAKEKREVLAQIQSGEIDIVIGTHALIQDQVEFQNLGLVIIDEQHRFGVDQRKKLKQKGYSPHFLVMTATPIPRTLSMTVYGDLDISVIDELPKGRQAIVTKVVYENKRDKVLNFMQEQVNEGRQAYVVYPLVEESEKIDLKNAVQEFENLKVAYPKIRFGLIHGKMKDTEKDQVMMAFRQHEIDVLVSTTVIEVGVDVANANLMIIEHTERFGLSQLHQLRGRVGRGEYKSYCVLMLPYAVSEDSKHRAEIMASTSNGFEIAEEDLKIRGPGEIMGRKQSGLSSFKLASLITDTHILMQARDAAFEVFKIDPQLAKPEHAALKALLLKHYGPNALIDIG